MNKSTYTLILYSKCKNLKYTDYSWSYFIWAENNFVNIFQFEPLNLEFIWKRYEINKFWSLKYEIRAKSVIK
jgi:hypothetical protein